MKKKNLIILLLIPFLIALLGVVTINATLTFVESDIISIKWDYDDIEAFKLREDRYLLEATGVSQKGYPAGTGNSLVWSVKNKDTSDTNEYASIVKDGSRYYLETHAAGDVIVTCSNEKGNVFRSMQAVIYENGAVIVQPKIKSSQNNIDEKVYYGEFDLENDAKTTAKIEFDIKVIPESLSDKLELESKSENIENVDLNTGLVKIKQNYITSNQEASFKISCGTETIMPTTVEFMIVNDGINVYSYDDLMYCTNASKNGEIAVLRKSFESVENAYVTNSSGNLVLVDEKPILKDNNVECFGHYDVKNETFDFKDEVYSFTTTYNKNFIDQWNTFLEAKGSKNLINNQIIVGLHIQKDFYGNGYTINLHNLTYPTGKEPVLDENGNVVELPKPASNDLFRGPLPFFSLGDHNNMPLIEALGQDNIGMYVDGNNILINDINLKNCDFGNLMSNLNYVGTVLETNGDNITITNSRMSNGRQVLRSYSSMNVTLKNSMLSNARNFLLTIGSNEFISVDDLATYTFENIDGSQTSTTISDYLMTNNQGDAAVNAFTTGEFASKELMKNNLLSLQKAFNPESLVKDLYKGSMIVEDTYFYRSGVASILIDSMFNGPFLYNSSPSLLKTILNLLQTQDGISLAEFNANNLSGISYPVELNITGSTKFFDYKTDNQLDTTGLINENISTFATSIEPSFSGTINIDKIFPIKSYLWSEASQNNCLYTQDGESYLNVPIAIYGGSTNLSKVTIDTIDAVEEYGEVLEIDLLEKYLSLEKSTDMITAIKNIMIKAVTAVTGYEPFKFICLEGNGYLFDETPKVSDLIENAKGE